VIRDEEYDGFYAAEKFNLSSNTFNNLLDELDEKKDLEEVKEDLNSSDIEIYTYEVK